MNDFLVTCQHQATVSDILFYDIFAPTKISSFEVSGDVIVCDLWFWALPIKNLGYAYVGVFSRELPQKVFGEKIAFFSGSTVV